MAISEKQQKKREPRQGFQRVKNTGRGKLRKDPSPFRAGTLFMPEPVWSRFPPKTAYKEIKRG